MTKIKNVIFLFNKFRKNRKKRNITNYVKSSKILFFFVENHFKFKDFKKFIGKKYLKVKIYRKKN